MFSISPSIFCKVQSYISNLVTLLKFRKIVKCLFYFKEHICDLCFMQIRNSRLVRLWNWNKCYKKFRQVVGMFSYFFNKTNQNQIVGKYLRNFHDTNALLAMNKASVQVQRSSRKRRIQCSSLLSGSTFKNDKCC